MISIARHVAAASTALPLLAGSPAAAQDMDSVIEMLGLPVGTTATYFNPATRMGIVEECFRQDADTVACDMRIMAGKALLDFTYQGMTYDIEGGELKITAGTLDQGTWNTDVYNYDFKPVVLANHHGSWNASSPLVQFAPDGQTIIQNDVLAITMPESEVRITGCSSLPITEHRGVDLCQSFEDKSPARANAVLVVASNGAVLSAQGETADRPYSSGDWDVAVSYGKNLRSGFMTVPPYILPN